MTSAQVVETSVTNNSSSQNCFHPDDHTIRMTATVKHNLGHNSPFLRVMPRSMLLGFSCVFVAQYCKGNPKTRNPQSGIRNRNQKPEPESGIRNLKNKMGKESNDHTIRMTATVKHNLGHNSPFLRVMPRSMLLGFSCVFVAQYCKGNPKTRNPESGIRNRN